MNPKIKNTRFNIRMEGTKGRTQGLSFCGVHRYEDAILEGFKSALFYLSQKNDFDKVNLRINIECSDCTGTGQDTTNPLRPKVCKGCKGDPTGEVLLNMNITRDDVKWTGFTIVENTSLSAESEAPSRAKAAKPKARKPVAKKTTAKTAKTAKTARPRG